MVNICELSFKRRQVKQAEDTLQRKLCGLSQKASSRGQELGNLLSWVTKLPANREDLTCPVVQVEHGKPVSAPTREVSKVGRAAARPTNGGAGRGDWRKQRLSCNGTDTD